ncbi:GGDEF domain-containing protein [Saccharothrix sp.]|uniref:GGDEF domain-containing protein n=1 Tax=Saccharothrix sp. TaxID=1873460 RepID=UPI002811B16A|nr:GGDEF domain-containing protein [Saccharothrix sp.]
MRSWQLWNRPRRVVVWVALVHVVATGFSSWSVMTAPFSPDDLLRATAVFAAAIVHMALTREPEERRRGAHRPGGEYVDQTSLWLFSSALVLPLPLSLALLVVVRTQRYLVARRPPHTYLFTSSAIALSVLCADLVATTTPLRAWLTLGAPLPHQPGEMAVALAAVTAALGGYFAAQALVIGIVRGLSTGDWSLRGLLGDRTTNTTILVILALAVGIAVLQSLSPPLALLLVPVAVRFARTEQRLQQAEADGAQLKADALHDPLTGLLNRRGFEPAAALALLDGERHDRPTATLFVDIDHFKRWNDILGHFGGDQVIKAVAGVLRQQTRHQDLVCRYGGEEMVVLLHGSGHAEAVDAAQRIRHAVQSLTTEVTLPAGGKPVRVGLDGVPCCTVSIGVAVTPDSREQFSDLAQRADEALFRAKNTGRNRVVVAEETPPSTPASLAEDRSSRPSLGRRRP